MSKAILFAPLLALSLCACSSDQLSRASAAYEDAFVPIEDIGRFDQWRQSAPLSKLLADGQPASLVEIGRRFEVGAGVPADPSCAGWWYERAFATVYEEPWSTADAKGRVYSGGSVRRTGYPKARVSYRKVMKTPGFERLSGAAGENRCAVDGASTAAR